MISLITKIFKLPRLQKKILIIIIDSIFCILSFIFSYIVIEKEFLITYSYDFFLMSLSSLTFMIFFVFCGFYNSIFRYLNIRYIDLKTFFLIFFVIIIYTLFNLSIFYISGVDQFKSNVIFMHSLVFIISIAYIRLFIVFLANFTTIRNHKRKNILIYGAGEAGISALHGLSDFNVLGFIDDDPQKQNTFLANVKVYSIKNIKDLILKNSVETIFIAISSLSINQKRTIIKNLQIFKIGIKFLPTIKDLTSERIGLKDFVSISPEDLVDRSVKWNKTKINNFYKNEIVCVTGAGGSIGSEISKQILKANISKLIIVDHSEINLYNIEKEILSLINQYKLHNIEIIKILGSILEAQVIDQIFKEKPNYIFHAAAYKHVNMIEDNAIIGIQNNIIGTLKLVDNAIKFKLKKFIFISTDKAVRPTSVMGYTKRIGEKYIENLSYNKNTKFVILRFGNVIGSSGSVFALFKDQIEKKLPITITHKDVTRYFMSVQEAVGLVLETSTNENNSNIIFLLNMGEPVKILDLAIKMVNLSGLTIKDKNNENGDIEFKYIGLKQGEKLHEELKFEENFQLTNHKDIFSIPSKAVDTKFNQDLKKEIDLIIQLNSNDEAKIKLKKLSEN